ncbi:MAG: TolC family protein [Clostridium sp.]|nr:TolC family protein [Clostridium sp.]
MDRKLAGNGRQVNQSDINRPEFGGRKGQSCQQPDRQSGGGRGRQKLNRRSSALKKAAALVLAASLALGGAVTSLAEEAGAAAGSQQIEYADLEQLIKGSNPEVQAKRADLDHWVGAYEAARDEIMENRARLREDARELKDDGDLEGYRHYQEQAKMLKESADQLDKQIRSLNSASNTMDIRQAEDTAILAAQDVMGTWHSLSLDRDSAGAKLEAAAYKKEKLERQLAEGMVAQADVDQAEKERLEALNRAEALDGELEQMKRELCLLTGHTYDAAVEIGALPVADLERAGALDLEADKQTAWGNSYELRGQRHGGFSGTNKERHSRDRSMEAAEQEMYTRLTALYGQVQTAKTSCQAARTALAGAELDWKAASHKKELDMISQEEYLTAKAAYMEARAAAGRAEIEMLGALNRYDWAVKGLTLEGA